MNWKILLGVYYSPGSIFRKKSGCPLKAYCEWTMTLEWFLYCYQTWKRKKERKTTTAEFSFLRATKWRIECLSGVIEASLCPLESSPFMAVAASNQPSFNAPIQAHVRRARNTRFSFPVSFAALQIFTQKKKKKKEKKKKNSLARRYSIVFRHSRHSCEICRILQHLHRIRWEL